MLYRKTRLFPQITGRNYPLVAAAILLLAFALRAWNLGDASLWADEASTAKWANTSFDDFLENRALPRGEIQLPLHIASLHLFPSSNELLLRFPSVMASMAGIATFMLLVRQIDTGRSMALWAGLILATNPLHVWLSRAARPYAYFFTGVVLVSFFFLLLLNGRRSKAIWTGFVISSFLAYLTHYFALFLPVVQYLLLGLYLKRFRGLLRPWLLAQIAAGSGLLALWIAQIIIDKPTAAGIAWIPEPSLFDIPLSLANMLTGYTGALAWYLAPGLLSAAAGFALGVGRAMRQRRPVDVFWLLLATVPLAVIFIASKIVHPLFVDRYLSEAQAGAVILMLVGWWRLPRHAGRYALAALVVLSGILVVYQTTSSGDDEREDWRAATQYIAAQVEPTDSIILDADYYELAFLHYFPETVIPRLMMVYEAEQLADADRVWVVYRNPIEDVHRQGVMPDFDPFDPTLSPTGEWLAARQDQVVQREDFNGITVLLLNMK